MRISGPVALGAALIVGAMAIIGVIDNLVRLIAAEAGLWQFQIVRSAMALPILLAVVAVLGLGLRPLRPARVAIRSGVNALAMLLYFGAIPMMPIAQVGAALFTAPIWVLVFSWAFFGHAIGPRRLAAVAAGFAGVLVMLRPDPAGLSLVVLMPVAAGALYGLSNLLTREWCAEEPVAALLTGFFLAMGLVSAAALVLLGVLGPDPAPAPFLLAGWQPLTLAFLGWVLVQALGALFAVGMLYRGYQSGETSALAVFEYTFLISATTAAWLLWGETVGPLDLLGMGLIALAGGIIAWRGGGGETLERRALRTAAPGARGQP